MISFRTGSSWWFANGMEASNDGHKVHNNIVNNVIVIVDDMKIHET